MSFLELSGSHVGLVMPELDQAGQAARYSTENRDHLSATSPILPKDYFTEAFWRRRLAESIEEFQADQSVRLFIKELSQPEAFIGSINFTQIFRGPFQACYLGYSIARSHEGKGLMSEALSLSIKYMFEEKHLHRIMANYLPENARSGNLLARLGFRIDGRSPDYLFINGAWREHILTSLTNPKWSPRREDVELFV